MIKEQFNSLVDEIKYGEFLSTGFPELDKQFWGGGVSAGKLIVLMGRAKVGKTYLLTNWIYRLLILGQKIMFFSLEMSAGDILARLLQILANDKMDNILVNLKYNPGIYSKLLQDFNVNEKLKILDKRGTNLKEIIDTIEREKNNCDFFMLDHILRIKTRSEKDRHTIDTILKTLSDTVLRTNTRMILASQVTRGHGDGSTMPAADTGKGSGSIEEDCDVLIGMCRPEIAPDCPTELRHKIQLMVLANRFGKMYKLITLPYDEESSIISDE